MNFCNSPSRLRWLSYRQSSDAVHRTGGAEVDWPAAESSDLCPAIQRRAAKDSPQRVGRLWGRSPPVKRSATPLFGLPIRVAEGSARAHDPARVARSEPSTPQRTSSEQGSRAFRRRAAKSLQKTRSSELRRLAGAHR